MSKRYVVLLALLITSWSLLYGADGADGVENTRKLRVNWQKIPECSRYELTLEQQAENAWNKFLSKETTENSAELNLPHGRYRFSIRGYSAGGQPGAASAWSEFYVSEPIPVPQAVTVPPPEAAAVEPAAGTSLFDDPAGPFFKLEALCLPLAIMPTGEFNMLFSDAAFQTAGLGLRFSILPIKLQKVRIGFELQPAWNYITTNDKFRSHFTHIPSLSLAAACHIMLRHNLALNIRAGGGAAMYYIYYKYFFSDSIEPEESFNKETFVATISGGFSINTFITKGLYIDIGIDYLHSFSHDDSQMIYLRPFLGLGWYF